MRLHEILAALRVERDKLTRAIEALEPATAVHVKERAIPAPNRRRKRWKMSAEARQRLSEAKRLWWAEKKGAARPSKRSRRTRD